MKVFKINGKKVIAPSFAKAIIIVPFLDNINSYNLTDEEMIKAVAQGKVISEYIEPEKETK